MFDEDDLLPLSALQHFIFCPRQCALIHVEGLWAENRLTVEGRHLHERADGTKLGPRDGGRIDERTRGVASPRPSGAAPRDHSIRASESDTGQNERAGSGWSELAKVRVRTVRGLPIRSLRLGLSGKADVVEFHRSVGPRLGGVEVPFPVEYKRGKPKAHRADEVQLCAQALCLEEMLALSPGAIKSGAVFYGRTRRRTEVLFDDEIRGLTERTAAAVHGMIRSGSTPRARRERKCDRCSLVDLCLPDGTETERSASRFLASIWRSAGGEGEL